MFRFFKRWRERRSDRRAVREWILSAGADPVRSLTVGEQHELMELLAKLAGSPTPIVVAEESGDPPPAGSKDEEGDDGSGYWLKDWQDIYAEEVCQKRFGPL